MDLTTLNNQDCLGRHWFWWWKGIICLCPGKHMAKFIYGLNVGPIFLSPHIVMMMDESGACLGFSFLPLEAFTMKECKTLTHCNTKSTQNLALDCILGGWLLAVCVGLPAPTRAQNDPVVFWVVSPSRNGVWFSMRLSNSHHTNITLSWNAQQRMSLAEDPAQASLSHFLLFIEKEKK